MYYVCIDLEMGEVEHGGGSAQFPLSHEVIQIGAVILDDQFHFNGGDDSFSMFVRPAHSSITPAIFELTGISDDMLAGACSFETAFGRYCEWVRARTGGGKFTTFCWSARDYVQLRDEISAKAGHRSDLSGNLDTFVDLQRSFSDILGTRTAVSLEKAVEFCHEKFEGRAHSAVVDAFNTAVVLNKIARAPGLGVSFPLIRGMERGKIEEERMRDARESTELESSLRSTFGAYLPKELLDSFGLSDENSKVQAEKEKSLAVDYSTYIPMNKLDRKLLRRQEKLLKMTKKLPLEIQHQIANHHPSLKYSIPPSKWMGFFVKMLYLKSDMYQRLRLPGDFPF